MKKAIYFLYPIISVLILFVAFICFDNFDGLNSWKNLNASMIARTIFMIIAGLTIGLEHWFCPATNNRSPILAIERIIIATLIFGLCFSSLGWFSGTSEWIWLMVAGYEIAAAISGFFAKAKN